MDNTLATQESTEGVQRPHCENCRHFQKDEYTGYCRIHHAYVLKTFWCIQFESALKSSEGV